MSQSWLLVRGGLFATARATPNKKTEEYKTVMRIIKNAKQ
jgi:hypothetical protein